MNPRDLEFNDFNAVRAELDRLQRGGYDKTGAWDLAPGLQSPRTIS